LAEWELIHEVERDNPFRFLSSRLPSGCLAIFGQAAHAPFGTVSIKDRQLAGESIKRKLSA